MQFKRHHSKVWLWWNRWCAIQITPQEWCQIGMHAEINRPLLDIFLPAITISLGRHPIITDDRYKHLHSCRGFIIGKYPEDAVF